MFIRPSVPAALVRVTVALLLGIHGATRALTGGVGGFGQFLSDKGFPKGVWIAWAITVFEIVGAPLFAFGRFTRPIALGYMTILTSGIFLVHAHNGWFVVGGETGGVEYSVLLIACLASVALSPSRA